MDLRMPRPRATVKIPRGLLRLNHRRSSRQDSTPAQPEIRRSSATNRAAASAGTRHSRFEGSNGVRGDGLAAADGVHTLVGLGLQVDLLGLDVQRFGQRLAHCREMRGDRKSTRLNSSHLVISYAVFCLKKKKKRHTL